MQLEREQIAEVLETAGVGRGDAVALYEMNSVDYFVMLSAIQRHRSDGDSGQLAADGRGTRPTSWRTLTPVRFSSTKSSLPVSTAWSIVPIVIGGSSIGEG